MIAGTANSVSVAEAGIFLMMSLARRGAAMDRMVKEGRWGDRYKEQMPVDMYGKTVLVVGFGKIGSRSARRLAAMECNASDNCCNDNGGPDVQTHPWLCQQDDVGIPRCTQVGDCADAGPKAGLPCSTSVECCGLACIPSGATDGGAPFICGSACEPKGSGCTTNADCCPGLPCVLPAGGSTGTCGSSLIDAGAPGDGGTADAGTCALYGQLCNSSADCCSSIPCLDGRCLTP
jgi:hypothetical protein